MTVYTGPVFEMAARQCDPPPEAMIAGVMQAYERSGGDHIDILLVP